MLVAFSQRAFWHAVLLTVFLHTLDDIVEHHLWSQVVTAFFKAFPLAWWNDEHPNPLDEGSQMANFDFYTKHLPRAKLEDFIIQTLAWYNQHWLERMLPTRPTPTRDAAQLAEKDKEVRGREEMETQIMQKLIAEGRVKPVGICWRNIFLRWLIDDTIGTAVFGAIAYLLHAATHMQTPAETAAELPWGILNMVLRHWFSAGPVLSLIGHAYVPLEYRLQFWAAADLALNIFLSVLLRPVMPWLMSRPFVQNYLKESAARAQQDAWWDREMARLEQERVKLDQEMDDMFASWKEKGVSDVGAGSEL